MARLSCVDLLEKLVAAGVGMDGAGDPTVVDGVAACSHFSVSSLMLVEPAGDLPEEDDFLSCPMGSSLGRSLELVLENFLSGDVYLDLPPPSGEVSGWTMLDRLDESAVSGISDALELRRLLQLKDLTVEAMLS